MAAGSPGSADRLGVTLLFSLMVHAVLVLGITFKLSPPVASTPALDVILTQSANRQAPEKADFLAQADHQGGGESDESRRPSQPVSSDLPSQDDGVAPMPLKVGSPPPRPAADLEQLSVQSSPQKVAKQTPAATASVEQLPSERQLLERQLEMARLAHEIQRESEQYAKRPRRKFISASTREYEYAAYLRAWAARIERIGTLNFPDQARRDQLYGQLVLTIGLGRDGTVTSVDVIKSSGHLVLDDAAKTILALAAPFPPIPQTDDPVDELYITRTWQFLPGDTLRTH